MKITYNENPLCTTVELDEHERQILWLKIKLEEYEEMLFDAYYRLKEENFDLESARKTLEPTYWCADHKSDLDKRVDELCKWYSETLMESHFGDCTCVPCSCRKCHVEHLMGINTLGTYPGKHALYRINNAFMYKDGEEWKSRPLAEALELLKNSKMSRVKPDSWKSQSQEEYESHIPKWEVDNVTAYEYLLNYAKEHNML